MDSNSWRNSGDSWKQNTVSSWYRGQAWDESPRFRGGFRGRVRGGFRGGFRGRGRGRGGSVLAVPILPHHKEAKKEKVVPRKVEEEDDIVEETETNKEKMEEMVKKQLEMLSKTDNSDNYEQDEYDDDDYFEEPAIKKKVEDIVDTSARPLVLATDPKLEQLLKEAKKAEETKNTPSQKTPKNRQENSQAKDNQHVKKDKRYNSNSWLNVYKQRVDSLKNNIIYDQSTQQQQQNASHIEKYQNVLKKMCAPGPSSAPYNGPSVPFNGPVNPIQDSPIDGVPIPYNGPVLPPQITPFDDLDTRRSKIQAPSLIDPLAATKRSSRFDKPPQTPFNGPVSSSAVGSGVPFNGPIQAPFNGPAPTTTTSTNVPFNGSFSAPFNGPVPHTSPFGIQQGFYEAGPSTGFFFSDSVAQRPNYRGGGNGKKGDETKKRKSGEPLILPKSAPKPLYAALTGQVREDEESHDEEDDLAIAKLREIMKIAKSSR